MDTEKLIKFLKHKGLWSQLVEGTIRTAQYDVTILHLLSISNQLGVNLNTVSEEYKNFE